MFDDMIADVEAYKKLSSVVSKSLLKGRELNISFVFISQSYFKVPNAIMLNVILYFIMKIPNKRELRQIASKHLSDIEFKDFMEIL